MLKIWKMDWFRMFKMKSTWILWIAMAVLLLFTTVMTSEELADPVMSAQNQQDLEEYYENNATPNLGMSVNIPTKPGEKATVYDMFYANVQGKAIALFLVIFAVLFATADIRNGYIKNVGGQVGNRTSLILSKATMLFVFTALTFLIAFGVQALSNWISFGYLEWGDFRGFGAYFGTEFALHFALALIVMALSIVIANNVFSMALAVALCMNLMTLAYGAFETVTKKVLGEGLNVLPYTVTGQISRIQMQITGKDAGKAVFVAVIYGIVAVGIGSIVFKKRDIR